ncbi:uncharacterized protein LOC111602984 [Drosophila hydei]|uniref:Uncharacterized protein LOC111602984 n=1 Tax=Drosophila hydei TaxID=7224 RepID=A0A6J1MA73_DROHY|nr:uncharacterized protein LOC111602984 [Drosophila hydei]
MSDFVEIPKKLLKLLSCDLCKSTYCVNNPDRQPNELSCRHIFCSGCVDQLAVRSAIVCPECGGQTLLPVFRSLIVHDGLLFLLQQLPALKLGRIMLQQQKEQRLQLKEDNVCRSPWPKGLNEVSVARFIQGDSGHCVFHDKPSSMWCHTCQRLLCNNCPLADHHGHESSRHLNSDELMRQMVKNQLELIEEEIKGAAVIASADLTLLRRLCDACVSTQQILQHEMLNHAPTLRLCQMRDWFLRARLQIQQHEVVANEVSPSQLVRLLKELIDRNAEFQQFTLYNYNECRLRAIIQESSLQPIDFEQLNRRLLSVRQLPEKISKVTSDPSPTLLLTNYCIYSYWWNMQCQVLIRKPNEQDGMQKDGKKKENLQEDMKQKNKERKNKEQNDKEQTDAGQKNKQQKKKEQQSNVQNDMKQDNKQKNQEMVKPILPHCQFNCNDFCTLWEETSNSSNNSPSNQGNDGKHPIRQLFDNKKNNRPQMLIATQPRPATSKSYEPDHNDKVQVSAELHPSPIKQQQQIMQIQKPQPIMLTDKQQQPIVLTQQKQPIKLIQKQQPIMQTQQHQSSIQAMQERSIKPNSFDYNMASTSAAAAAAAAAATAAQAVIVPNLPIYPMSPMQLNYSPSPVSYPVYFLDMEIAGNRIGRIIIEVYDDVAPRMAENFRLLILHGRGFGFKGCSVFQTWNNDSIVTGDFELQNGRGGFSALEDRFFMPDKTGLIAQRGTVGMRRGHKRYDNNGFVGSQFRLVLNDTRSYTAIFGFIVDGINLLDRIAGLGDTNGNPMVSISIMNCGKYRRGNL